MSNQKGQAVVEYLLMIIVTVSLLFAAKGMFTGAETFMYKYMGEYIACLMEYGELPAAGVSDSDLKNQTGAGGGKVCNSKFDGFSVSNGRPPTSTSGTSATSSKSSSNNQSSKNSSQSASSQSKSSNADSNKNKTSNGLSDSLANQNRSSSPYSSGKITRSSGGSGTADGRNSFSGDDKVRVIEDGSGLTNVSGSSDDGNYASTRIRYERTRYKAITGGAADELDRKNKFSRTPRVSILTVIDESGRMQSRKNTISAYERKPAAINEKDEEGFTFGNFVKWLIIAAIGISIFLFFGSQVMSFMNSKEK
ncbi:MAG: hypothetical protein WA160_08190 [Pseudobdellovibrio sp.]